MSAIAGVRLRPTQGHLLIGASRVFMPVSGVLAGVLLARNLGTEGRGAIAAAIVYAEIAPAVFAAGLGAAARSLIARRDLEPDLAMTAAIRAAQPWILFVAPVALIVFALVGPLSITSTAGIATTLLFVTTLGTAHRIIIEGATGATGAYGLHAMIAFLVNLIPLLAIGVLALVGQLTVASALVAYSVGYQVAAIVGMFGARHRADVPRPEPEEIVEATTQMRREWKSAAPSQILDLLNRRLDLLLIVVLATDSDIGVFAVAASAARLPTLAAQISTITASTARREAGDDARPRTDHLRRLAVFLFVATVVIAVAGWILIPRVYGADFGGSVRLLGPLLAGTCAMTLAQVASAVLLIDGRARLVTVAQATGVALTSVTVPVGYLSFDLLGAAAGSTIGYLATAVIVLRSRQGHGAPQPAGPGS